MQYEVLSFPTPNALLYLVENQPLKIINFLPQLRLLHLGLLPQTYIFDSTI